MKTNLRLLFLMAGIVLSVTGRAQTLSPCAISSSGGFFSSASVSLSSTVAEMTLVQTFTSLGNILTQGFQQPEDFSVGIHESLITVNNVSIYPNPSNGAFVIELYSPGNNTSSIKLLNLVGQQIQIQNYPLTAGINKISYDISSLSQGIYILEIYPNNQNIKAHPIVKKINLIY